MSVTLSNFALLYDVQGKYDLAEPLYQKSLAIKEKILGQGHPSVTADLNNLAGLYYAQGKYEQAEILYKRSLVIKERILGENHPRVAISLNGLATVSYTHLDVYKRQLERSSLRSRNA